MTKLQSGYEKYTPFLPLTSKCDLNIGVMDLDLARDTQSDGGKNFWQVILKSTKE